MPLLRPLAPLLLTTALAGCSGTPLGEQLSRSFSAPQAAAPAARTTPAAPAAAPAPPPPPAASSPAAGNAPPKPGNDTAPKATANARRAAVAPAPYRITIKLPLADPSAPAEVVTEALRAAGVPFEVEMIERMGATGSATPPTPAPAPQPR
jgi:hypothetical protein